MDEQKRKRRGGSHETRPPARLPDHLLCLWRHGDPIPRLATGLAARFEPLAEAAELARAADLTVAEVEARQRRGNRAYLARVGGEVAAYGWACHGTAECGWRNLPFTVPQGDCYLWDFATLPRWRGNGLYPALLTWILGREEPISCYWIMHNRDNKASRRGIARAGFRLAAALYDLPDGRFRIEPIADPPLAQLATVAFADLLAPRTEANQEAA
jgi:GNAT superfamily N-acetyltransferase